MDTAARRTGDTKAKGDKSPRISRKIPFFPIRGQAAAFDASKVRPRVDTNSSPQKDQASSTDNQGTRRRTYSEGQQTLQDQQVIKMVRPATADGVKPFSPLVISYMPSTGSADEVDAPAGFDAVLISPKKGADDIHFVIPKDVTSLDSISHRSRASSLNTKARPSKLPGRITDSANTTEGIRRRTLSNGSQERPLVSATKGQSVTTAANQRAPGDTSHTTSTTERQKMATRKVSTMPNRRSLSATDITAYQQTPTLTGSKIPVRSRSDHTKDAETAETSGFRPQTLENGHSCRSRAHSLESKVRPTRPSKLPGRTTDSANTTEGIRRRTLSNGSQIPVRSKSDHTKDGETAATSGFRPQTLENGHSCRLRAHSLESKVRPTRPSRLPVRTIKAARSKEVTMIDGPCRAANHNCSRQEIDKTSTPHAHIPSTPPAHTPTPPWGQVSHPADPQVVLQEGCSKEDTDALSSSPSHADKSSLTHHQIPLQPKSPECTHGSPTCNAEGKRETTPTSRREATPTSRREATPTSRWEAMPTRRSPHQPVTVLQELLEEPASESSNPSPVPRVATSSPDPTPTPKLKRPNGRIPDIVIWNVAGTVTERIVSPVIGTLPSWDSIDETSECNRTTNM